jgi:sortase A
MRALRSLLLFFVLGLAGLVGGACAPPGSPAVAPEWFHSAAIGASLPVHEGIEQHVVDRGGAAWDPFSANPGELGTTLLFGHRASHGSPFLHLDDLSAGDTVELTGPDGHTYVYSVVDTRITNNTWDEILAFQPASGRGLSLISCHPIGSAAQRIVVDAELTDVL